MGALADDVNTPLAISELHQLYKAANDGDNKALNAFYNSCKFLGILKPVIFSNEFGSNLVILFL